MKLPIKLKIFLGLTSILLIVLGLNLYFSSQLFIKDKTSYIYENGLQRLEDLSYQFQGPIKQAFQNIKPYILLANDNTEQFQSLFNSNNSIKFFSFKQVGKEWEIFSKEKHTQLTDWFNQNKKTISFSKEIKINSIRVDKVDYLLLSVQTDSLKVVSILDLSYLVDLMGTSRLFKYYLLNNRGVPFLKGGKVSTNHLKKALSTDAIRGTTKAMKGTDELLVSYVKIPDLKIILASEIKSADAFRAAKELISRSFFIGMIILGFSIILSLFFSSRLTKPIHLLFNATQDFTAGKYDRRVEIKTTDELKTLGDSFNSMAGEIGKLLEEQKEMILKLEDYNLNLEKMVDERTAELQEANNFIEAMINSLNQGLLVFDKDLSISDTFTKSCNEIFGMDIKDKKYNEILELDEKAAGILKKGVGLIFSEKLPFASASKLISQNKITGKNFEDEAFKHVALEYFPLKTNDELSHIVVVATDKTDEIKAIEAFKDKEAYVNMVTKLVSNKKQFLNFVTDIKKSLEMIYNELESNEPNYDLVLMQYHTINGGSGTYSVLGLQKNARASEQTIIDAKDKGEYPLDKIFDDFNKVSSEFGKLESSLDLILGSNKNSVEIDKDVILGLLSKMKGNVDQAIYNEAEDKLFNEEVISYLDEYISLVDKIAAKTGKQVEPLNIQGGDIRVPPEKIDRFFNSLVHLFRNCVDHGIEKPEKREEYGKDPVGKIAIDITKENNVLTMNVEDDGGGINPERIREKWLEMHPGDDSIHGMADEEVIYKIFDPTFSTTDELSEFSGRGVGMSAIKETVDELGGQTLLSSQVNKGTKFTFSIPL